MKRPTKRPTKRLEIKTTTVRNLSDDDLRGVAGGECPTYARNCSLGLCPGSDYATCRSVFASECVMCP